uniref:Uncharacterized protein n=1 Tax=Chromera velia CCMP2878 TaxID=1169474 RepID=A0A0G4ICZ7_9ALVE|eukprot:Cvel_100.t1-p1 / transcript=Cvel_100.t1 / gene=Cvel_100 / organism=Chromera_velia_CCMP2878 / gene_product=hypothetical protein / transcript_product=hypothetical protein / location=Cvel_scaffold8:75492-75821(-) / protein_length=110 / sequence_SO=supercontig / SO=protein_coding / is_pseudo=false
MKFSPSVLLFLLVLEGAAEGATTAQSGGDTAEGAAGGATTARSGGDTAEGAVERRRKTTAGVFKPSTQAGQATTTVVAAEAATPGAEVVVVSTPTQVAAWRPGWSWWYGG